MRYANLFDFWFDITHCACLILLIQLLLQQMILLYLYQVWFWEKGDNLKKFRSRHKRFFGGILIILFFSKPEIHYMRQGEISVCKVPVSINNCAGKQWLFPLSKIWIVLISANEWVSVLAQFLLKNNMTHVLVTSSLFR